MHKVIIDKSTAPPNVPDSLIKIETVFELDDTVVGGITFVIRIEDDSDIYSTKWCNCTNRRSSNWSRVDNKFSFPAKVIDIAWYEQ